MTTRASVSVELLDQLVPGPAAAGVACGASNNNLDLVRTGGRWYLAWRTAPVHFASADARIEVSSTDDLGGEWTHETTVALGADVREPRWVVDDDGEPHLFFMELGTDPKRFQPRRVHHARRGAAGAWRSTPLDIEADVVPWRTRRLRGRWAMVGYRGGEAMYGPFPKDPAVQIRWSDDLVEWGAPVEIHRGGIECELVELPDGRLVGVTRNEGPTRFGSDVLVGADLGSLAVHPVRRKLDSPFLFLWDGEPWLVARRSLAFGGNYDLAPRWVPGAAAIRIDQLVWWLGRKRSALYRVDPDGGAVEWVADLPSRGDTSFASVTVDDDGSLIVADYTSPESVGDVPWVRGQLRPTVINLLRVTRS